jgi:hypothetical protein
MFKFNDGNYFSIGRPIFSADDTVYLNIGREILRDMPDPAYFLYPMTEMLRDEDDD